VALLLELSLLDFDSPSVHTGHEYHHMIHNTWKKLKSVDHTPDLTYPLGACELLKYLCPLEFGPSTSLSSFLDS